MALTRKFLAALGIDNDKVDEIIQAHTETSLLVITFDSISVRIRPLIPRKIFLFDFPFIHRSEHTESVFT